MSCSPGMMGLHVQVHGRLRQKKHEFKAGLGYKARPYRKTKKKFFPFEPSTTMNEEQSCIWLDFVGFAFETASYFGAWLASDS